MGKLVIIPSQNNEYRFKLAADDGQTVIVSESMQQKLLLQGRVTHSNQKLQLINCL